MSAHTWSDAAKASIEELLQKTVSNAAICSKLRSAISYSIFSGGKRIRPLLAIALCEDLTDGPSKITGAAAALELLHCSSLVHDDLPCVDNDDMRRGKPSCHRAHGEATALFAGNSEISLAIELVCNSDLQAELKVEIARELSVAYTELCDGQQLDLLNGSERGDITVLYQKKTGALFGAACAIGAIGAGASKSLIESARKYGRELGVYFQLIDDSIDANPEKGRVGSSDSRNDKVTAITLHGASAIQESSMRVEKALEEIEAQTNSTLARVRILISELFSS